MVGLRILRGLLLPHHRAGTRGESRWLSASGFWFLLTTHHARCTVVTLLVSD